MKKFLVLLLSAVLFFSLFNFTAAINSENSAHAFIYEADVRELHYMLKEGIITSRDLTEYYLARIETYNKQFNCFVTMTADPLSVADECDKVIASGEDFPLFYGIPIVIKDNIHLEGYPTSNGYADITAKQDESAAAVSLLLEQGAIVLGKTNMSTEAQMAKYSISEAAGETHNAYATDLSAGGSSGGSAVAVSLNFASVGLGTDTNSSLRYPSALNGCVALRASFGLIDRSGVVTLNRRRDVVGGITRTVTDQAVLLDTLTENKYGFEKNLNSNLSGMKIGIFKELSKITENSPFGGTVDSEIIASFNKAVSELEKLGAEIIEVSLPNIFSYVTLCSENLSGNTKSKENYYKAFEEMLEESGVSAVIFPTYLHTPNSSGYKADTEEYMNTCSYLSPPLGLPEISVQIGRHSEGAGIGMEIASLRNKEQTVLNVAYAYTESYNKRTVSVLAPETHTAGGETLGTYSFKNQIGPFEFLSKAIDCFK